ncbi:hypothetical protein BDZ97DRAFT_1757610 [Flammula alnicola]|nr:hypothetical protein BDZ97DRAFT_1757610 [Flammula alnicola]
MAGKFKKCAGHLKAQAMGGWVAAWVVSRLMLLKFRKNTKNGTEATLLLERQLFYMARTIKAPAERPLRRQGEAGGWRNQATPNWTSADLPTRLREGLGHLRELPPSTPPVNDAGVSKSQIFTDTRTVWRGGISNTGTSSPKRAIHSEAQPRLTKPVNLDFGNTVAHDRRCVRRQPPKMT